MTPGAGGTRAAVSPIRQAPLRAAKSRREHTEGGGALLELLFTIQETAKLLKIHPQTVRGYIGHSVLTKVVLGPNTIRLRADEVMRLAEIGVIAFAAERSIPLTFPPRRPAPKKKQEGAR